MESEERLVALLFNLGLAGPMNDAGGAVPSSLAAVLPCLIGCRLIPVGCALPRLLWKPIHETHP